MEQLIIVKKLEKDDWVDSVNIKHKRWNETYVHEEVNKNIEIFKLPKEEELREILKESFENKELDYRHLTSKMESAIFQAIKLIFKQN